MAAAMALCQEEEEGSDAGNVKEESAKDNRSEGGGDDNEKAARVDGDRAGDVVVCAGCGDNEGSSIGGIRPTKSPPMRRKMRQGLRAVTYSHVSYDPFFSPTGDDRHKMVRFFYPLLPLAIFTLTLILTLKYPYFLLLRT